MPSQLTPDDEAAFAVFCKENRAKVYRAMRLVTGNRETAEDATSEAFIAAYVRWETVTACDNPLSWVIQAAKNRHIDEWRRWHGKWSGASVEEFIPPEQLDLPADPRLAAALQRLSPKQREALAWRYVGELPRDEIAWLMKVAPSTVKEHLERGLARLRELLTDEPPEEVTT